MRGLLIACAKRPITPEKIDAHHEYRGGIALEPAQRDQIARFGRFGAGPSGHLGRRRYIRFASVYKDFQNVEEFSEALKELG